MRRLFRDTRGLAVISMAAIGLLLTWGREKIRDNRAWRPYQYQFGEAADRARLTDGAAGERLCAIIH